MRTLQQYITEETQPKKVGNVNLPKDTKQTAKADKELNDVPAEKKAEELTPLDEINQILVINSRGDIIDYKESIMSQNGYGVKKLMGIIKGGDKKTTPVVKKLEREVSVQYGLPEEVDENIRNRMKDNADTEAYLTVCDGDYCEYYCCVW